MAVIPRKDDRRESRGFDARGFCGGSDRKEPACNAGDLGSVPGLGRFPWRREWQPTPVFLPGEFHRPKSLVGYSPWGVKLQTSDSFFLNNFE